MQSVQCWLSRRFYRHVSGMAWWGLLLLVSGMLAGCHATTAPIRVEFNEVNAKINFWLAASQGAAMDSDQSTVESISRSLRNGESKALDALLDIPALMNISVAGLEDQRALVDEVASRLDKQLSISDLLAGHFGPVREVDVAYVERTQTGSRVTFRLLGRDHLDYLGVTLQKTNPHGGLRIVDLMFVSQGEPMSRIIRRAILTLRLARGISVKGADEGELAFIENRPELEQIDQLLADQRVDEVKKLMAKLPATVAQSRPMLLAQLRHATRSNDAQRFTAAWNSLLSHQTEDERAHFVAAVNHLQSLRREDVHAVSNTLAQHRSDDSSLPLIATRLRNDSSRIGTPLTYYAVGESSLWIGPAQASAD